MTQLEYLGHLHTQLEFICNVFLTEVAGQQNCEQTVLFIFTVICCCPQLFSPELKIKNKINFFSFLKVQLVCGSLKQEVDTEEAEAASFDKAECCHHNANSRMQSAKKTQTDTFLQTCSDAF